MQTDADTREPRAADAANGTHYSITALLSADSDTLLALFDLRGCNDDEPARIGRLRQG